MTSTSNSKAPAAPASLAGQRVLLTGATGLVGRAMLRALVGVGARITALLRKDARLDAPLAALLEHSERVTVSGWAPTEVREAMRGRAFDLVVHLGAYGVKPAEQDALAMVEGNVGVTAALLEALAAAPPRRFLFAGSSAQYRPLPAPARLDEEAVQQPLNLYGECKRAAEQVGALLARQLSIPFVALRLFGVYGPGEAPHRMLPYLARTLAAGRTPELTAGAQMRDWIYVDDVAEGLCAALAAPLSQSAYNLCSGVGVSVREVARLAGAALHQPESALGLGTRPYRADEPMWIVGDPTRLSAATGWRARTPLEEGVRRTVEWALAAAAEAP